MLADLAKWALPMRGEPRMRKIAFTPGWGQLVANGIMQSLHNRATRSCDPQRTTHVARRGGQPLLAIQAARIKFLEPYARLVAAQ